MQAKVFLNQPLTQVRYGLHFEKGVALCDNEYIITKLQKKGVKVEIIEEPKEKTLEEKTVTELKEYAAENNIEIPSNVKNKADIIDFIKNYNAEDTKEEKPEDTKEGTENPETNPEGNTEENPEEKNAEGEENPKAE